MITVADPEMHLEGPGPATPKLRLLHAWNRLCALGEVEEYIVRLIDSTYFLHYTYILVYIPWHNSDMSMTLALFDEYTDT